MPVQGDFAPVPVGEHSYDAYHFALNLLMMQASGLERSYSFNAASWSLTPEVFCYAAFLAIAMLAGARMRTFSAIAVFLAVASDGASGFDIMPGEIARGFCGFFMGVLIQRHHEAIDRIGFWTLLALLAVAIAVPKAMGSEWTLNYGMRLSLMAWPLVVVLSMRGPGPVVLALPGMRTLGDLSYSMYLVHLPVMMIFILANSGALFEARELAMVAPAYLATVLALSWVSYRWLEEPARRRINRMSGSAARQKRNKEK
jgi:peptidoglycan/LPS O-acetylase OafA/YrhL